MVAETVVVKRKVGRNEPCPCGSGKKYKHCCWNKGFKWEVDDDGNVSKGLPLHPEIRALFDKEAEEFRKEHGRDPYPDELIFRDLGHPEHVEARFVDKMKEIGIDPALIYAFEKTGRIVIEGNKNRLSDIELREWDEAVEEYHRRIAQGDTPDI